MKTKNEVAPKRVRGLKPYNDLTAYEKNGRTQTGAWIETPNV